ncbi:proline-rich family protein [Zea mays]|nr:proline-rich family protein [Zea mays]ONM52122.1 proline-rich family protein [Zea mays]ONM52125.1 proline-rich family protein [Zea mays]
MKTTKGGKAMNPTDAFRKEQRKKELKRNKKERKKVRDVGILKKDPEAIWEQIEKLEKMKADGALDKARKHKKRQLEDTYNLIVKKRKEYEQKMKEKGEQPIMFSHLAPPKRRPTGDEDGRANPKPEDSVYYHPTLNPSGAPPPGKPPMYKSSIGPRIPPPSSSSTGASSSMSESEAGPTTLPPPPPPPPLPDTSESIDPPAPPFPLPPLPPLPPPPPKPNSDAALPGLPLPPPGPPLRESVSGHTVLPPPLPPSQRSSNPPPASSANESKTDSAWVSTLDLFCIFTSASNPFVNASNPFPYCSNVWILAFVTLSDVTLFAALSCVASTTPATWVVTKII